MPLSAHTGSRGRSLGAGRHQLPRSTARAKETRGFGGERTLPMRVTGTPYSRAEMAVHLPVPFWPALSLIFGSRCLPSLSRNLRMLAVISMRKESSSVLFHSSNT